MSSENKSIHKEESNVVPFDQSEASSRFPTTPMKSDLVEEASKIITDPQVLVNIISQRVRQLNTGRAPLINALPSMGAADIALTEVIEGKVKLVETEKGK